jgi:predicted TIM-barrel fold metal-dependent hydrolase
MESSYSLKVDAYSHISPPGIRMFCERIIRADHIVFGADMPLGDHYFGFRSYRQTINAIEAMDITDAEKRKIFADNALRLLRIPV